MNNTTWSKSPPVRRTSLGDFRASKISNPIRLFTFKGQDHSQIRVLTWRFSPICHQIAMVRDLEGTIGNSLYGHYSLPLLLFIQCFLYPILLFLLLQSKTPPLPRRHLLIPSTLLPIIIYNSKKAPIELPNPFSLSIYHSCLLLHLLPHSEVSIRPNWRPTQTLRQI